MGNSDRAIRAAQYRAASDCPGCPYCLLVNLGANGPDFKRPVRRSLVDLHGSCGPSTGNLSCHHARRLCYHYGYVPIGADHARSATDGEQIVATTSRLYRLVGAATLAVCRDSEVGYSRHALQALWSVRSLVALRPPDSTLPCRSLRSDGSCRPLRSLRSSRSGISLFTLGPLWPGRPLLSGGPCRSHYALRSLCACLALFTGVSGKTLRSDRPLLSPRSRRSSGGAVLSGRSLRSGRSLIALRSLWASVARFTPGALVASRSLWSSGRPLRALRPLRPYGALRPLRPDWSLRTRVALRPHRSLRPYRPGRAFVSGTSGDRKHHGYHESHGS